jgi:hypothetical protein
MHPAGRKKTDQASLTDLSLTAILSATTLQFHYGNPTQEPGSSGNHIGFSGDEQR